MGTALVRTDVGYAYIKALGNRQGPVRLRRTGPRLRLGVAPGCPRVSNVVATLRVTNPHAEREDYISNCTITRRQ